MTTQLEVAHSYYDAETHECKNKEPGNRLLNFQTPYTCGTLGIAGGRPASWKQLIYSPAGDQCFTVFFVRNSSAVFVPPTGIAVSYNGGIFINKPRYTPQGQAPSSMPVIYAYFDCAESFFGMLKENYGINPSAFSGSPAPSIQISGNPELEYIYYYLGKLLTLQTQEQHVDMLVKDLVTILMDTLVGKLMGKQLPKNVIKNYTTTVGRAKEYIFRNFHREISLNELARHCYASPFHFSRIFKQFTSCAPHQYIQVLRLKHAEILIKTTTLSIAEISERSGFTRTDYFSAAFKKRYGVSPSVYKKQLW